jgi:signal transduction histidine kinase
MWQRVSSQVRARPMIFAIVATLCAAGFVLYHQYQALTALQAQSRALLQQISDQTAADVAVEVRRTLDGPVTDTLLAVTHSELREGRLDVVAEQFRRGLERYPQVQRFFVWTKEVDALTPGEAVFRGRESADEVAYVTPAAGAAFARDSTLGKTIIDIARRGSREQHIYVTDQAEPGQQLFLRLYWADARRLDYYAILGYVASSASLPDMFAVLHERRLKALLERRGGERPLELRVINDRGAIVFGPPEAPESIASVSESMEFYPAARIESRLVSAGIPPPVWRFEVGATHADRGLVRGYWPTAASVLLMLVAFGLTLQASRRADDLARMQADFIAHASHQLKTPLSLLSAATETVEIARVRSPEKVSEYLGLIRHEVSRLSTLVQRILEFSRVQQARSYEFESIDLAALVRETVEAFASSLSSRHFTFHIEQPGAAPTVVADPAAIEQVLANLLDNAVKYSGESREVRVVIRAMGNLAAIDVIDRGAGLTRADRLRIFDKFYRGSAATPNRKGFGLGLPIVQELVRAHKGRVEVSSVPGAGSTFTVILPATGSIERSDGSADAARIREATT